MASICDRRWSLSLVPFPDAYTTKWFMFDGVAVVLLPVEEEEEEFVCECGLVDENDDDDMIGCCQIGLNGFFFCGLFQKSNFFIVE